MNKLLIILRKGFFGNSDSFQRALMDMNRGRMAIAGEETIEAGKGISGLGC